MKTIYSDQHRLHDPKVEFSGGRFVPGFEIPRCAEMVLARVQEQRLGPRAPAGRGRTVGDRAHPRCGLRGIPGDRLRRMAAGLWRQQRHPRHLDRAGHAAQAAEPHRRALRLLLFRRRHRHDRRQLAGGQGRRRGRVERATPDRRGERAAFALSRPPGHHAGHDFYGGYRFLNNAAIAAQAFRDSGAARVAILDVDFHHGNGTQEIFYRRDDVLFCSLHGHPEDEYPYFSGFADERGEGSGEGFNHNYPLRPGTAWDSYRAALADALSKIAAFAPDALVVSLGVDTFERDPISRFKLRSEDYLRIGEMTAAANRPTLFIMEGGYAVEEIGINAVNVLTGFEQSAA